MTEDWLNREELSQMEPKKKERLIAFFQELQGCPKKQVMPLFLRFQQEMKAQNLLFTREEAQLMIRLLKETMSDQEKEKLGKILQKGEAAGKKHP